MTKTFTVSDALLLLFTTKTVTVVTHGEIGTRFTLEDGYHSVHDQQQPLFDRAQVTSINVDDNGYVTINALLNN